MKAFDEITPSEGFLSAILSAIPSGVFVIDGDQNIVLINQAAARLAGRSKGDCFDRKCYEVFNTILCRTDSCLCRQASREDTLKQGITIMHRGTTEIPIEYATRPIKNIHGKIIGCVSHIVDISERLEKERLIAEQHEQVLKLLKEKASQNLELDRANEELFQLTRDLEGLAQERTIAEMALRIADRIRNPATAIGGLARKLAGQLSGKEAAGAKLRAIVREAEKLEEQVRGFERLAREHSQLFTREDLRDIIAETIETLSGSRWGKKVTIDYRPPARPVMATVNRRTLKVALLHVLRNAMEASPEGGTITIVLRHEEGRPTIRIRDQGPGIDPHIRARIFARTVSTKPKGPGRGLMLVKQILREHQGEVNIRSSRGKGTTVTMRFPIRWQEPEGTEER